MAALSIVNVLVAARTLVTTVAACTPVPRTFIPTLTGAMFATAVTVPLEEVRVPVVATVASKPWMPGSTPITP